MIATRFSEFELPRVDSRRLLARLEMLSSIGACASGGVSRLAYGEADAQARRLVLGWMRDAGLRADMDPAGNLIGTLDGTDCDLMLATGSHLDSVPDGGALDGAFGVVAAVEVAAALHSARVSLRHPMAVVAFSNEEGAHGTPGMTGSLALSGQLTDDHLRSRSDHGTSLDQLITSCGGRPELIAGSAWKAGSVAAFVELHIEQGPVLDAEGLTIGVVEAITGRTVFDLFVEGQANHAGTTPMGMRHDAMVAAAEAVLAVERLATSGSVTAATCGTIEARPNTRNVIPGAVRLGCELRDVDPSRMEDAVGRLRTELDDLAATRGCRVVLSVRETVEACRCDPRLVSLVSEAAEQLGMAARLMVSGAGHDAQVMAALGPIAMLFVPSRSGVSHAAAEHSEPEQLAAGADALLRTIWLADRELP